jgi:hypothetical protein
LLGFEQGGGCLPVGLVGAMIGRHKEPALGIRQKHCRADENAVYLDDLGFLHGPYYYDRISSLLGPPSQAGSFTKK